MQGDVDAAPEIASLLDDADVSVRRKAAAVLFDLRAPSAVDSLARAAARDEDRQVRCWCVLALARGPRGDRDDPPSLDEKLRALLRDDDGAWRRLAALVLAERGDGSGDQELAAWWTEAHSTLDLDRAKELLAAMANVRDRAAVVPLLQSLDDVRLRPHIADTLGAIGDPSASPALLAALMEERYVTTRPHEARALAALGVRSDLRAPLARLAGLPEPMREAILVARDAGLLDAANGGFRSEAPSERVDATLVVARAAVPMRLLVLTGTPSGALAGTIDDGADAPFPIQQDASRALKCDAPSALFVVDVNATAASRLTVHLTESSGIAALWLVARADELPPPAPKPWR